MSWMEKLYRTYERCAGHEQAGAEPLMPICHTTQQAHIEVVLDGSGTFQRASVLDKGSGTTLIPCTEESGGRSGSKPVNHPLCDKLQYIAGDYLLFGGKVTSGFAADPAEPHRDYLQSLAAWAAAGAGHRKLDAILAYVRKGQVIADLARAKILTLDAQGRLLTEWNGEKDQAPPLFKVVSNEQTQADAFVRWCIEDGELASATWKDTGLIAAWIAYYQSTQTQQGFCMVSGNTAALAIQHPAKLRHGGDKAKLISANDNTGYTFRGRFFEATEAASVGFEVTQKAHNALRWLIARQGARNGDQVVVSWAPSGKPVPDPFESSFDLCKDLDPGMAEVLSPADTAEAFAHRLKRVIAGYQVKLGPTEDIVVMGIDSATPGRMAVTYYRELLGSEFLQRLEDWHWKYAWPQDFGKDRRFIGAPAPREVAEAAYGAQLDDKLKKASVERLLPCIVDGVPIPRDLVESTTRRATNRAGKEHWEWEKCLGIACALFKGSNTDRSYQMALELDRTSRDYLYGRLLALAEHIEGRALYLAGEKREPTAARLMQRFADRPASTWKTIELALRPYMARLRSLRPGSLYAMEKALDDVIVMFAGNDFTDDAALTAEFLLGYHCQRRALRPESATTDDATQDIHV